MFRAGVDEGTRFRPDVDEPGEAQGETMTRRTGIAGIWTIALVMTALAASPNFSGTWVLDKEKSDQPPFGGRRGGGGQQGPTDVTLIVKQTDNELTVTRKINMGGEERTSEAKYTLDGKENSNPGFGRGGGQVLSKTKWDKDKLVTTGKRKVNFQGNEFESETQEVRSLSADGKTMTVETTTTTPQGDRTGKQVYNKQ